MTVPAAPLEVLESVGRRGSLDAGQIPGFVRSWLAGVASDAQMTAWNATAERLGMDDESLRVFAGALVASGDRLELSSLGAVGDIVAVGGVGGAAGLAAAPLAAALGVTAAVLAEPARSVFGGRLEPIQSIPGFDVAPSLRAYLSGVREGGCQMIAPPDRIAPAVPRMLSLAEQTGALRASPGVVAAVAARLVAAGAPVAVLDLPHGDGALLADPETVRAFASAVSDIAGAWGRRVGWVSSPADAPRGRMVGPALEVAEAIELLHGGGAAEPRGIAVALAGRLAELAGVVDEDGGREAAGRVLAAGDAIPVAEAWLTRAGADPEVLHDPERLLPRAPLQLEVPAARSGTVTGIAARAIGEAVRRLGGGRLHPAQVVDPAVGVEFLVGIGEPVEAGEPLAVVHARDRAMGDESVQAVGAAMSVGDGDADSGLRPPVTDRDA